MQMLYNSDSYVVVRFDLPSGDVEAGEPSEQGLSLIHI